MTELDQVAELVYERREVTRVDRPVPLPPSQLVTRPDPGTREDDTVGVHRG